jgi:hypothetical protein
LRLVGTIVNELRNKAIRIGLISGNNLIFRGQIDANVSEFLSDVIKFVMKQVGSHFSFLLFGLLDHMLGFLRLLFDFLKRASCL